MWQRVLLGTFLLTGRFGLKPGTVGEAARGPLAAITASQAGLTAGSGRLNLSHPSPLPGMTLALALTPDTESPKKPETDWEREVWTWVEPEYNVLKPKTPLSKADGACVFICLQHWEAHAKEFARCLTVHV